MTNQEENSDLTEDINRVRLTLQYADENSRFGMRGEIDAFERIVKMLDMKKPDPKSVTQASKITPAEWANYAFFIMAKNPEIWLTHGLPDEQKEARIKKIIEGIIITAIAALNI